MDREGVSQGDADPVRDDLGWLSLATDEDRELVAADACQRVPFADAPAEALADRAQQLVAARVAEPVVDLFEVVEVDEDQHERADGDRLIEPLGEEQPVGQLRQRVVVYLMRESVLHVVQALGQLPLRTHGDHLPNGDQQRSARSRAQSSNADSVAVRCRDGSSTAPPFRGTRRRATRAAPSRRLRVARLVAGYGGRSSTA